MQSKQIRNKMAIETKPPLGLRPEKMCIQNRMSEIHAAIDRYNEANYEIPVYGGMNF